MLPNNDKAKECIDAIKEQWAIHGDGDNRKLAYILATIYHETAATMLPITEYGSDKYLKSKKYYPFIGRGFIQLTWDYNYKHVGNIIGQKLYEHPELALHPAIAAEIAVRGMVDGWFTGRKLRDYINSEKQDYTNARRIINGLDKAQMIAGYVDNILLEI